MIQLSIPATSELVYGIVSDMPVGPFSPVGASTEQNIPMTLDVDSLDQGFGSLYGEKAVWHSKADGNVRYVAALPDVIPNPQPTRRNWCTWNTRSYPGKGNTTASLPAGYISSGSYDVDWQPSSRIHYTWLNSEVGFAKFFFTSAASSPTKITSPTKYEFRNIRFEGGKIWYESRLTNYSTPIFGYETGINWTTSGSGASVVAVIGKLSVSFVGNWSSGSVTAFYTRGTTSVSPSRMKLDISALVANKLDPLEPFPQGAVDYGDLAMDATKKANANNVNMIAFLRDIRKPWELIPKLRNMWKLKTLAENYLVFDYGILPTIDDLKAIFAACKKVRPYLDKNGFETYTASGTTEYVIGDVPFHVIQRIKVAIGKNDFVFNDLIRKVDSIGFLPTLQNVWDLIPYSFVIDWFVDIGSLLERIDADIRILQLPIRYATMSRKVTADLTLSPTANFPYSGTVNKVQYQRWVTDHCPVPTPSVSQTPDFDHWIESAALLITRKK